MEQTTPVITIYLLTSSFSLTSMNYISITVDECFGDSFSQAITIVERVFLDNWLLETFCNNSAQNKNLYTTPVAKSLNTDPLNKVNYIFNGSGNIHQFLIYSYQDFPLLKHKYLVECKCGIKPTTNTRVMKYTILHSLFPLLGSHSNFDLVRSRMGTNLYYFV